MMPYDRLLVKTRDELDYVLSVIFESGVVSFDLETDDLEGNEIWGVCLGSPPSELYNGMAAYIACEASCELEWDYLKPIIDDLFNSDRLIVGHNLKFDFKVCMKHHITPPKMYFDTMVASWMVSNNERQHNLREVAKRFLNVEIPKDLLSIRELNDPTSKVYDPWAYWEHMLRYGSNDAILPLELKTCLEKKLDKLGLMTPFYTLEMPMVVVTAILESSGIPMDLEHLKALQERFTGELKALTTEMQSSAMALIGKEINFGSPVQVSELLFDSKHLIPLPWMKKGKPRGKAKTPGAWPTNESVLKAYETNPLCQKILEHRKLSKMMSAYIEPLIGLVAEYPRIFTGFNQTGTDTGRYSSSKPFNAQTMPKDKGCIRKAIKASPGFKIVAADYSQVELRIMAHVSRDPEMCRAFRAGEDLHRGYAAVILDKDPKDVTDEDRRKAKAANFGFIYGMGAKKFVKYAHDDYGLVFTESQAQVMRDTYFTRHSGVAKFHDKLKDLIPRQGFTRNIIGEVKFLDGADSDDSYERWSAWSRGTNYMIQGSAAAMIKVAMRNIFSELVFPHGVRYSSLYGRIVSCWGSPSLAHEVRLIMQVHDELVFEVREEIAEPFAEWLKFQMENAIKGLEVPILVEYGIGDTYEDAK